MCIVGHRYMPDDGIQPLQPTVETCELSEGTQLELQKIYHRREIRALQDVADYWRILCLVTWAVVAACVVLS